jgi:hypothetical protein
VLVTKKLNGGVGAVAGAGGTAGGASAARAADKFNNKVQTTNGILFISVLFFKEG